jgi:predicted protein tyrosine phosphatase
MKTKYLFVCSVNINRSKTAEHLFAEQYKGTPFQFKSCGTAISHIEENRDQHTKNSVPLSKELVDWADVILCMENEHAEIIEATCGKTAREKAYVLGVPDVFVYMDPVLCEMLLDKVKIGYNRSI